VDDLVHRSTSVQGKPTARWGRKARDLGPNASAKTARSPDLMRTATKESNVKANLARFTTAIALLATMAMSLGAGMRWY
jgi:hypothetical protein